MPRISLLFISLYFFIAGIGHFIFADVLVLAMPSYLPFHQQLVSISGVIEVLGALGILLPQTRLYAAYGLIALSVAVFPTDISMALNANTFEEIPAFLLYLRIPFQAFLIWYIWWSVDDERSSKNESSIVVPIAQNSKLEAVCKDFIGTFHGLLHWKWDDRYQLALAEFGVADEEKIHRVIEQYFKKIWNAETIDTAPNNIRAVIADMGGLKSGQLLFTSELIEDSFIYCMLWPWGNQKTISIRISPSYTFSSEEDKAQQIQKVKNWFGIKPQTSGWVKITNDSISAI